MSAELLTLAAKVYYGFGSSLGGVAHDAQGAEATIILKLDLTFTPSGIKSDSQNCSLARISILHCELNLHQHQVLRLFHGARCSFSLTHFRLFPTAGMISHNVCKHLLLDANLRRRIHAVLCDNNDF